MTAETDFLQSGAAISTLLESAAIHAENVPPQMTLLIDESIGTVELILDTKRVTYGEWIKGEGADICLYRDMDSKEVVGCCLRLLQQRLAVDWIKSD